MLEPVRTFGPCPGCDHQRDTTCYGMVDATGREIPVWYCDDCAEEVATDTIYDGGWSFGFVGMFVPRWDRWDRWDSITRGA